MKGAFKQRFFKTRNSKKGRKKTTHEDDERNGFLVWFGFCFWWGGGVGRGAGCGGVGGWLVGNGERASSATRSSSKGGGWALRSGGTEVLRWCVGGVCGYVRVSGSRHKYEQAGPRRPAAAATAASFCVDSISDSIRFGSKSRRVVLIRWSVGRSNRSIDSGARPCRNPSDPVVCGPSWAKGDVCACIDC